MKDFRRAFGEATRKAAIVPPRARIIPIFLLFAVYVVTARLGLGLYAVHDFAALVWPPTGIALAALLLYGYELWPGIALGALVTNLSVGATPEVAIGIAVGNTLEALTGLWLLRRSGFDNSFSRVRQSAAFLAIAAVLAPPIAATIGAGTLLAAGFIAAADFLQTWGAWWIGDALGAIVLTPLTVTWLSGNERRCPAPYMERLVFAVVLLAVNYAVVWNPIANTHGDTYKYLIIFPLTWAALRLGLRGKTLAVFTTALIATAATIMGAGPYGAGSIGSGLLDMQIFIAAIAGLFLLFASMEEERSRSKEELEGYVDRLEQTLQQMRLENSVTAAVVELPAERQREKRPRRSQAAKTEPEMVG